MFLSFHCVKSNLNLRFLCIYNNYVVKKNSLHIKIFFVGIVLSLISFYPLNYLGFTIPKILFLNLTLFISYIFCLRNEKINLYEIFGTISSKLILLYFFLYGIYTLFSISPLSSLLGDSQLMQGLFNQILYLSLFIIVSVFSKNNENQIYIIKSILYANLITVTYALLQFINIDPLAAAWMGEKFLDRTFSTLGNPNWLASFIILTLPVVFYFYEKHYFYKILFLLNIIALISTSSKAGILAFVVIVMIYLFKYFKNHFTYKIKLNQIYLCLAFILLLFIGFVTFNNRYSSNFELGRSTNARKIIWSSTIEAVKVNPLGYGVETLQFVYPKFNNPKLWEFENITARINRSHNQILDLWFQIGPFGVLVFYSFLIVILFTHFKENKDSIRFLLSLSLIGYALTNLFGFVTIGTEIVFWIIVAILSHNVENLKLGEVSLFRNIFSKIIVICLTFIVFIIGIYNVKHLIAEVYFTKASNDLQQQDYLSAINNFEKSISIYRYDRIYLLQTSEVLLAFSNDENKDFLNLIETYLNQLNHLSNYNDPEVPILEAWLFAIKGENEKFQNKLSEAKQSNPYSILTYKIAFEIYKYLGNEEQAEIEKQNIMNLLPYFWKDKNTDAGRIFWKNNAWLKQFVAPVK